MVRFNLNCTCSFLLSVPLYFNYVSFSWVLLESSIRELRASFRVLPEVSIVLRIPLIISIVARILLELGIQDGVAAELLDFFVGFHPRPLEDDMASLCICLSQDVAIGVVRALLPHSEGHVLAGVVGQVG